MMFHTRISCYPPLGQPTVIPYHDNQICFTVLLETTEDTTVDGWQVNLWHNCHNGEEWKASNLSILEPKAKQSPLIIHRDANAYRKHFLFTAILGKPSLGSGKHEFTIRYRRQDRDWIWVNNISNVSNGELILQRPSLPDDIRTSFSRFTSTAHVQPILSEVSDTKLWSLDFDTPSAGKESAIQDNVLGVPMYVARWWALVREWAAWLRPAHGHGVFEVQKDTLTCSFLCRDGLHLVLLAISGVDDTQTVFRDDGFGAVVVKARNERMKSTKARVLAAIGFTHETALSATIYAARNLMQRGSYSVAEPLSLISLSDTVDTKWRSSWSDGLGYCTWNGLGQKLTEGKIFKALKTLRDSNVKIQTLIIDDNWQTLDQTNPDSHYHTWSDFEANPAAFPRGLKATISDIREQNPSIVHIAVWHAMFGYWGGITPDGPIAEKYKTKQINRMETGRKGFEATKLTVIDADEVQLFYQDFYGFLARAGIDAVKTDAQMMLDLIADPEDRRTIIRAYEDAWNLTGLVHFGDKLISCMSHFPGNIFHSLLPKVRPAITLRNSDDFWPEILDSHPWHIFTNAHNALLTQHLNVIPDWDMFQTTHEFAAFHAAARCISGGPIYITDEPGNHNTELIQQMTAETVRGTTVILRPNTVARAVSSSVYNSSDEPKLLKIGAYHGRSETGAGILGVFNCSKVPLNDLIHLSDFRGVIKKQQYVVHNYTTNQTSNLSLDSETCVISVDLPVRGWEILTSHPLTNFTKDDKSIDIVPLGLVDKMSGAAAITWYEIQEKGQRIYLSVSLKALGVLGIYISDLEQKTLEEDFLIMISEKIIPIKSVHIHGGILKIDAVAAWKAILGPSESWSNELVIDVFVAW